MKERILVVDDQRIPRLAVSGVLTEAGYEAIAEADGRSGIERALQWGPDVIILDVQMPDMDGFAVVEQLKQDPRTTAIPVIFLTAEAPTEERIVRGLDLGAYDFLSKGCSGAELLARVGVMARIKRNHDELAALARVSDTLLRTLDPAELGQLLVEEIRQVFRADAVLLLRETGEEEVRAGVRIDPADPRVDELAATLREWLARAAGLGAVALDQIGGAGGALLVEHGFRSSVAVHVHPSTGDPVLLAVFAERADAFRGEDDAPLLRLLATQAVNALNHAILHARTREQARKMEEQAERLERAISERSRFFASISHELRTPINAVVGYGQLLEDGVYGALTDAQTEAIGRVLRSSQHLLELVNDVLDISKIEAGKLEIFPEPIDLAALLRDTLTSVHFQAEKKGLVLEVDAPKALPVVTDPARVRQILLNLLSNAVKFTDRGGVYTTARAVPDTEPGWVEVRVRDTGAGIAPDDLQRIFEEFEQANGAAARGGTGLGLAISRRLADLLGGDLRVESEPGEGSTFTVRLPRGGVTTEP